MTFDEAWQSKSDEQLVAASRRLSEYTDLGQRAIAAELRGRRELGLINDVVHGCKEDSTVAIELPDGFGRLPSGNVARLWRGYVPLRVTYWLWGVVGGLLWRVVVFLAALNNLEGLSLLGSVLSMCYFVFVGDVAIWRSAGRYRGRRAWAELARVSVAVGAARTVAGIVTG